MTNNREHDHFLEVLPTVSESMPLPYIPDDNSHPEFNIGIDQNFNKQDAEQVPGQPY